MDERPATDPQTGLPVGYEPPAPSRDDTRYPRQPRRPRLPKEKKQWPRLLRALVIGVVIIAGLVSDDSEDEDSPDRLPPAQAVVYSPLQQSPELAAYLHKVERICQAYDSAAGPEMVSIDFIVREQTHFTAQVAAVPAPLGAANIRRQLLEARGRVDAIAVRAREAMSRSAHPRHAFHELDPEVERRVANMYAVFRSFGIECDVSL